MSTIHNHQMATAPPTPSICGVGLDHSWGCDFDTGVPDLLAVYATQLALDQRSTKECPPDSSPAVCIFNVAFHLVLRAILTGDRTDVPPALQGLANAHTVVEAQRLKYLNPVQNFAESVPAVGGLLSFLWTPVQNATDTVLDATGLRRDAAKYDQCMVHAALAAESLVQICQCILLFMSGQTPAGLPVAHSAYRCLLSIPADTASRYAQDVRDFGLGMYTLGLSYIPTLYRVGFNAVAISAGLSQADGIRMLEACASRTYKKTVAPTLSSLALIGLAFIQTERHGTEEEKRVGMHRMARERKHLTQLNSDPSIPNNVMIQWVIIGMDSHQHNYVKGRPVRREEGIGVVWCMCGCVACVCCGDGLTFD